jgi:IrrE N-terminal-like domain
VNTFWRRSDVEDFAWDTLLRARRETGLPLTPPIDVDLIGELLCELRWDWDPLPESGGKIVWAGLYPRERRVVLNETHKATFVAKPGLERFSKAHEIGHDLMHVDHATLDHPVLPGLELPELFICRNGDRSWREKQAEWFAAVLLMPRPLFLPIARQFDLLRWASLYDLARTFDVTISALRVRLAELNLTYIDTRGHLYASKDAYFGQMMLGLT